MTNVRIIERPAFGILGKKVWITGPDNEQFGNFWQKCRSEGLFDLFDQIKQQAGRVTGLQTDAAVLGVSRVESDPANRSFFYMVAIEAPRELATGDLEYFRVPASKWAVFECKGKVPESIASAEIFAFTEWLPASRFTHALAPEMEVYLANPDAETCEFWLPVMDKG